MRVRADCIFAEALEGAEGQQLKVPKSSPLIPDSMDEMKEYLRRNETDEAPASIFEPFYDESW